MGGRGAVRGQREERDSGGEERGEGRRGGERRGEGGMWERGEGRREERRGERGVVMRGLQTYSRPVSYKHVPGAP